LIRSSYEGYTPDSKEWWRQTKGVLLKNQEEDDDDVPSEKQDQVVSV
jgi:Fic family protein